MGVAPPLLTETVFPQSCSLYIFFRAQSEMPTYKLHYFNLRGRAELARLILAYANVEYKDFRIPSEEWPKHKPNYPFGQVPVLEVDGKMLGQSNSIARYLAKKHGLAGQDDWEEAMANMYADSLMDVINAGLPYRFESDPEKKKQLLQELVTKNVRPHIQLIEKRLAENGTGYLVGSSLTWADLGYADVIPTFLELVPDLLDNAPHLKKLINAIEAIPSIKKWIETRPVTPM